MSTLRGMTVAWDSAVLSAVPLEPRVMAEDVASELGLLSASVIEVVRLHLEALDSALSLGAPELLADQMRWQLVRLRSAGAPFGPDEVDEAVTINLAQEALHDALDELPDRERKVLKLRYGLNGERDPASLEEIGRQLGLTRERVRQIEAKALERLAVRREIAALQGVV